MKTAIEWHFYGTQNRILYRMLQICSVDCCASQLIFTVGEATWRMNNRTTVMSASALTAVEFAKTATGTTAP
eukprot:scaffold8347_cov51-Cylindrotheca_fusiformis.AAC.1